MSPPVSRLSNAIRALDVSTVPRLLFQFRIEMLGRPLPMFRVRPRRLHVDLRSCDFGGYELAQRPVFGHPLSP